MNKTSISSRAVHSGKVSGATLLATVIATVALSAATSAIAAPTDIAQTPLTGGASGAVKPNIMLLMDTSRTLSFTHMPDQVEDAIASIPGVNFIGYKSFQCNSLYFNPNGTYALPKDASGTSLAAPSYTNAAYNGYDTSQGYVNLSSAFQAYRADFGDSPRNTLAYNPVDASGNRSDTPQAGYYYVYTGPQLLANGKLTPLVAPCTDIDTGVASISATGGGTWTRYSVNTAPAAIQLKFAIWYSYYRTRINLTKSAVSLAFTPITDAYRVGFITTLPTTIPGGPSGTPIDPAKYLAINDFGATQRTAWFDKLFAQVPGFTSPTREALARVGRHYAGKQDYINTGMTGDPVQYSCQQNFVIMTTDGYWNTGAETPSVGGPVGLDGTTRVGQQDGSLAAAGPTTGTYQPCELGGNNCAPRPMWDGGGNTSTVTTDKSNEYQQIPCTSPFFFWTKSQVSRTTAQQLRRTDQYTTFTTQTTQTDFTQLRSTTQALRDTTQPLQTTEQYRVNTVQNLANTRRQEQTRFQMILTSSVTYNQDTIQRLRTETVYRANTTRIVANTRIVRQTTLQQQQTTLQNLRTIIQNRSTTSRVTRTRAQSSAVESQIRQDTSQTTRTQTQVLKDTIQILAYDNITELTTPVATCPTVPVGRYTCTNNITAPVFVATCTAAAASVANSFTQTNCTPTTPVVAFVDPATCVNGVGPGPAFITTSCSTATTPPTLVASCTPQTAAAGNSWLQRNCVTTTTFGPAWVSSCVAQLPAAGNSFTTRTCNVSVGGVAPVNDGPSPVPSASCTANQIAAAGNDWLGITCTNIGPTTQFISSACVASGETLGNNYTTTTCPGVVTTENKLPVASCSASSGSSPNWFITTCGTNVPTAPTFVASCTVGTTSSGSPNHILTTCANTIDTPNVPISGTCVASTSGAPNHIRVSCPADIVATGVGVATCTVGTGVSPTWVRTELCTPTNLTNVPIQNVCAVTGANAGNNWTAITSCPPALITANIPQAGNCTPGSPAATSPTWVNITCPAPATTALVNVGASCTPIAPVSGNFFTETRCFATGGTSVPASLTQCPAVGPSVPPVAGQTCSVNNAFAPVGIASCVDGTVTPGAGPSFINSVCQPAVVLSNVPIQNACATTPANAGNNWTQITSCPAAATTSNFVPPCTVGTTLGVSPNWITSTCTKTIDLINVPVAACTTQTAGAGNSWTNISCPPPTIVTGEAVASCTVGQVISPFRTVTACNTATTTDVPVAVGSCSVGANIGSFTFVTACNTLTPAPVFSDSCVATTGASPPFLRRQCTVNTSPTTPVASCVPGVTNSNSPNFILTTCTLNTTGPVAVQDGTCVPVNAPGVAPSYTAVTCTRNDSGPDFVAAASCPTTIAGTAGNSWLTTTCTPVTSNSGPTPTTCPGAGGMSEAPSAGNSFMTTTCTPAPGKKQQYRTSTSVLSQFYSNGTEVNITAPVLSGPTGWTDMNSGVCFADNAAAPDPVLPPLFANGRPGDSGRPLNPTPPGACTAWPCVVNTGGFGGRADTLADVAQYYYVNDLRPTLENNVPATGSSTEGDNATWQHMTTFSIGLGVSGVLQYDANYKSATTGAIADIRNDTTGAASWPLPPALGDLPNSEKAATIDDFWHAAINGRGQYFSADNPQSVISGLSAALFAINDRQGAGAAAGASASRLIQGVDNFAYFSYYVTQRWTGELEARQLDINTAIPSATVSWSAKTLLDAKAKAACDDRNIYLIRKGASNNRVNFSWNSQRCDAGGNPTGASDTGLNATEQAFFDSSRVLAFSQYAAMTDGTSGSVDQRTPAAGANLVNFIRGHRGKEGFESNEINKLYRRRESIFGATINAQPVYMKALAAEYQDAGYAGYRSSVANRTAMIYVPANDGMLHAFYAGESSSDPNAGKEAWALIPTSVLPNLYKLADNNFGTNFQYTVDGSPTVGDAYDTSAAAWKTILVAGLNSGGKSYYAVDVTDPVSPKPIWEFSWSNTCYDGTAATAGADCHLGYTFGVPVLTKLADGTWVVLVTSGYNNINSPAKIGDGQGYLYILNAFTGKIIRKISTGVGTAATPSGLSRISNFVDNTKVNNTTLRVYGGDLLGNLWRFDINDMIAPAGYEATLVTTLKDGSGNPQPITTRPELGETEGKTILLVGTGRLLGTSDLSDTSRQSLYGVVDTIPTDGSTLYPNIRSSLRPLTLTTVGSGATAYRTIACTGTTVQCAGTNGWFVDWPDSGERVNIDLRLQLGTLVAATNVPQGTACNIGGYSYLNSVNFATGLAVAGSANNSVTQKIVPTSGSTGLTTGFNFFQVPDGTVRGFVTDALGNRISVQPPVSVAPPVGKRISWQEITQ
jgi:Tfp pilus tip-associated adhesin PilY1